MTVASMTEIRHRFDVLGIGNAIMDVLGRVEEDTLVREGLVKGEMRLVDASRSAAVYAAVGQTVLSSGGSAGNTVAGVASLGGRAAYIGKVADDAFGKAYAHDMNAAGIRFETAPLVGGAPTATSIILITADGERTMNTHLGACLELGPDDIDEATVAAAAITYLEGYLWDPPAAKEAFRKAAAVAHAHGRQVAITLSDSFCVDRHRAEFLDLLRTGTVDIVFANEGELKALYETPDRAAAVDALRADCALAAVTLGAEGSLAITAGETHHVRAQPVEAVIDLTGAGDLYAAGFLFGLSRGADLPTCCRLSGVAAAEVISHIGPRPQRSLADLAAEAGLAIG
jgi:sugar/nucleoside kinase (ribokinase family)